MSSLRINRTDGDTTILLAYLSIRSKDTACLRAPRKIVKGLAEQSAGEVILSGVAYQVRVTLPD